MEPTVNLGHSMPVRSPSYFRCVKFADTLKYVSKYSFKSIFFRFREFVNRDAVIRIFIIFFHAQVCRNDVFFFYNFSW